MRFADLLDVTPAGLIQDRDINTREKVNKSIESLFYEYENREVIILNTCDIVAHRADRLYGKRQAYFDEGIVRAEQGAA